MATAEISKLPQERPLNYKGFRYLRLLTHFDSYDEIKINIYFDFGRSDSYPFSGKTKQIYDAGSNRTQEAESFCEAAQTAWTTKYSHSEDEHKEFVKQKLSEKWIELNGEELIHKKLDLK